MFFSRFVKCINKLLFLSLFLFLCFFPIYIVAYNAYRDRAKIEDLANDRTKRIAGDVVGQPKRRGSKTEQTNVLSIAVTEADERKHHRNNGKKLKEEISKRRLFPKIRKTEAYERK